MREEISQIVSYELQDPRLAMVTVTDVRVAANLKSAKVYVTVAGNEEDHKVALAALRHAAPYLRKEIGLSLNIPHIPDLHFLRDRVEEEGQRVDQLLARIEKEWEGTERKDEG